MVCEHQCTYMYNSPLETIFRAEESEIVGERGGSRRKFGRVEESRGRGRWGAEGAEGR